MGLQPGEQPGKWACRLVKWLAEWGMTLKPGERAYILVIGLAEWGMGLQRLVNKLAE